MNSYSENHGENNYLNLWGRKLLELGPEEPFLDLGCGQGRMLGKLHKSGHRDIFGIDISLEASNKSREKDDGIKMPGHLVNGFLDHLPFADNSFSSAALMAVIHHLKSPGNVFKEAFRVLKPNGTLFVGEAYLSNYLRVMANVVLKIYPIAGDRHFYNPDKIEKMAAENGFCKKELIWLSLSYILVFRKC